jgi:hypothetical protein
MDLSQKGECSHLAVIGDLRRSRALADRAAVQQRLEAALVQVNRDLADELSAAFVVTLGDEFQGLLRRAAAAIPALMALDGALGDLPVRYSLGWGALATRLRPEAVGMDGPCFHAARSALEMGKREQRWVTASGFGPRHDAILNGMLRLMGEVRDRWTRTQAATVRAMRGAPTQKEVAAQRGVSESTVSKALKGAMYDAMIEAEAALTTLLEELDGEGRSREARDLEGRGTGPRGPEGGG